MIPALVQWEITDLCPYRCPHCYHKGLKGAGSVALGLDDKQAWQVAKIISDNRLFFVTFTGGEPLMRKNLLFELVNFFRQNGIVVSLNTSLAVFDEEIINRLNVDRMLISCPATDSKLYHEATGNGQYERFEQRLRWLIEAGHNMTVNMVVTKLNYNAVRQTAQRMADIGVKRFAATPASINASNPNFRILLTAQEVRLVIDDLIWAYEKLGLRVDIMESIPKCLMPSKAFELELPFVFRSCHAGKRNGTIGTQGEVRPCSHNPRVFGNLLEDDIGIIWDRMHNWREKSGNFHKDCLGCDIFNQCGGGCRIDAAVRCGTLDARHPYMLESFSIPKMKPKEIRLAANNLIRPVKSFQSRPENGGWLVAPGSPRNIIRVNQATYDFLTATRGLPTMSVGDLALRFGTTFNDVAFQRVIIALTRKQFFIIDN